MDNIVGTATLAFLVAVVARIAFGPSEWVVMTAIGFAIAAPCAWYIWRGAKANEDLTACLHGALSSVVVGGIFLLIDTSIGRGKSPGASIWEDAQHSGSPFGIVLTLAICPGSTCIFLAGAARAAYQRWGRNA